MESLESESGKEQKEVRLTILLLLHSKFSSFVIWDFEPASSIFTAKFPRPYRGSTIFSDFCFTFCSSNFKSSGFVSIVRLFNFMDVLSFVLFSSHLLFLFPFLFQKFPSFKAIERERIEKSAETAGISLPVSGHGGLNHYSFKFLLHGSGFFARES